VSAKDRYWAAGPCRGADLGGLFGFDGDICVAEGFEGGRALGAFLLAN